MHDRHIFGHFLFQTSTTHARFAVFPQKTDTMTLPSYPQILLTRHGTVVVRSGMNQQIV